MQRLQQHLVPWRCAINDSFHDYPGNVFLKAIGNSQGRSICHFTLDPIVRHGLGIARFGRYSIALQLSCLPTSISSWGFLYVE